MLQLAGGFVRPVPVRGLQGKQAVEALKQQGHYDGLRQAFKAARHRIEPLERYAARCWNRTQGLRVEFTAEKLLLVHRRGSLQMWLAAYGRGERLKAPGRALPVIHGNRVEYHRGEIVEWYLNEERGLEQGFNFSRRPDSGGAGPLVLVLETEGELEPRGRPVADGVEFVRGGEPVLHYSGLKSWDAQGRPVQGRLEVAGKQVRIVVDDGGAKYPLTIDPLFTQQAKLMAADGAAGDEFGYSVALSGNTALVGAPGDDIGGKADQGSAYVFVRTGTLWTEQAKLVASDGEAGDRLGESVAVSADTAVVGAPYDDVGANSNQGSAYVFVRNGTVWTQQAKLTVPEGESWDLFGYSVAVGGDTAVVGAPLASVGSTRGVGAAYVFVRSGTSWTRQAKLAPADSAAYDEVGASVAISGETVLVGASGKSVGERPQQGAAYVFVRSGALWSEQAKLLASDGAATDYFGGSAALSGDTALIGASGDDVGANPNQGSAYVFVRSGAAWSQQAKLVASDGAPEDAFGAQLALSGDTALVGARYHDVGFRQDQGAAYAFTRSGSLWTQRVKMVASDGAAGDYFGVSVALTSDTALVGAHNHNVGAKLDQGAAWIFVPRTPVAVLRDTAGSVRLLPYGSTITHNAGGIFAGDPSPAQDYLGNTFAVARDAWGSLWANVFTAGTQSWGAWSPGGGVTQGVPAIAVAGATAYIAARDTWNSYWLTNYTPGSGFGSWVYLAGFFSTDPVMCAAPDGSLYIIGKDNWNSLWSGRYLPGTGFQNWVWGQGIVKGKPSVACGTDGAAYVAVRDMWDSLWMARISGNTWTGWHYGGGIMSADPQAASAGAGVIYTAIRDPWGGVWYRGLTEGSLPGWLAWAFTGGVLQDFSAAGASGEIFIAGRDGSNGLWWYRASGGWTWSGNVGVAAGPLAAAPR